MCELLLWCPQVNLGRYQAPVHVASRTLCHFSAKAFLWNAAAFQIGLRGIDRKAAPLRAADVASSSSGAAASSSSGAASSSSGAASLSGAAPDAGAAPKPTLKQEAHLGWAESTTNQLDRAAYLFGSVHNLHLQKIVVRVLQPCSEYHSRRLTSCPARVETSNVGQLQRRLACHHTCHSMFFCCMRPWALVRLSWIIH